MVRGVKIFISIFNAIFIRSAHKLGFTVYFCRGVRQEVFMKEKTVKVKVKVTLVQALR